jgi:cytidyltransferase-like protein
LVGGCFDVLHYGHMQFLEQARAEGTYLIVALEPDESIIQYKKRKPIHNQKQRAYNLAQLRSVDKVLLLPSLKGYQDYNQLVQDVHPDVIAITADDPQKQNKLKQAKDSKAQLKVVIERLKGFSTTKIIQGYNSCNSKGKRVV